VQEAMDDATVALLIGAGYLVWAALIYAIVGTWVTHLVGRPLIRLNFDQERYEADFRFSLVRVHESAEVIALQKGERDDPSDRANIVFHSSFPCIRIVFYVY